MKRCDLVGWLDKTLCNGDFKEEAVNGLQVEGDDEVELLAIAVDACQATIDAAVAAGAQMLLVHHGLFWGRCEPLVGTHGKRVKKMMQNGLSLYASHLPLDAHPELGNNAELARLLSVHDRQPFGDYHGMTIGFAGSIAPLSPAELGQKLKAMFGAPPMILPFGPDPIERVALVSGGGWSLMEETRDSGFDALISGEGLHQCYLVAEDGGLNVFFAGHYATETLGVRAVARAVEGKFGLPWTFLSHPTQM
ncbi:MAG: Nif3-like dinuclear metal center hexameric protein [Proteobacteria bacterium]|jgi:dinuclear metal center YbgI/SA1388 family protein|nr:Nif3-like dinuclear metal center hexameric protein [Pseudomonadota bacterium]